MFYSFPVDLSKSPHTDLDGMDFTVGNEKVYTNGIKEFINPMAFVKDMNFDVNTLKNLDKLIMPDDDDDDLLRNLATYKNQINEIKLAKQAADRLKSDETASNNNNFNDNLKKNGALLHESERKKISLKLKPTTTLKQQTKELSESFVDIEPNDQELELSKELSIQIENEIENKPVTNEHIEQIEKRSSERSTSMASSKKKSSHRKDERKSRRSEDRKSRRSEERSRSKPSADRRSRRSEDRKAEKRTKRDEERRSRRSEDRRSRRSEERRPRRSEEKRSRRSEERRSKRRHDRSPVSPAHYRDSYYSPSYRNRSLSPLPRGPRTPPNTPPPNATEFDEFRSDDMNMRHMPAYGNHTMPPPAAHYQPGPNQFSAPNLPPNVPNYMTDYTAYMHPNRAPIPQQYNRPPPGINAPSGMMATMGTNSEYYYHNSSPHAAPPHHLPNQSIPSNSYSNLIEVSPYGTPNSSNVDCIRKQSESNRRKPTIAVQKGNVLEIVPSAELLCDRNAIDPTDIEKTDKVLAIEKQHQQALLRQKQDRIKRKMERHQKRLDRAKRKDFLLTELSRLSHLMTVGDDGKIVKASEILKSLTFDGTNVKLANANDTDEHDTHEDIYIEPPIHSYDAQAIVSKGILSGRIDVDKITKKYVMMRL